MGLYPIICATCNKPFNWFSGCLDQRCPDCQKSNKGANKKMKKSELEAKLFELEKKIAVLEARPVCYGHYCGCHTHNYPNQPYSPAYPYYGIWCGTSSGDSPTSPIIS